MKFLKTLLIASALLVCTSVTFANDQGAGSGTVAETMTSGGYIYVRLEEDDAWLASTPMSLAVGDKVEYSSGLIMENFTSSSLNRTFDSIRFVEKLRVAGQLDADAHTAAAASEMGGFAKSATAEAPDAGEIAPLEGGKTIADVYADLEQLKDQQIALRARVMKVSKNIMGKNWITLQDGTGTAPNNRLIATSSEVITVGDLVTVKGVVHTNVDLGSGYNYTVLLEEATFNR